VTTSERVLDGHTSRQTMGKFAAVVNSLYVLAGIALFVTGEAPVITPATDFLGDKFAMAWAGWKFSGCFYLALVNWGVDLGLAGAITMLPYIAFDVLAVTDASHWTPLAYGLIALEALTALTALRGNLKFGGVINALYVLAGVLLFVTGEAPVITPSVDFLGDKFAMAWAGWKFSGCLYYSLLNLGVHEGLTMFVAMVPYTLFDLFAFNDAAHWTRLSASFIVLDGCMGMLGLASYMQQAQRRSKAD